MNFLVLAAFESLATVLSYAKDLNDGPEQAKPKGSSKLKPKLADKKQPPSKENGVPNVSNNPETKIVAKKAPGNVIEN